MKVRGYLIWSKNKCSEFTFRSSMMVFSYSEWNNFFSSSVGVPNKFLLTFSTLDRSIECDSATILTTALHLIRFINCLGDHDLASIGNTQD